jgi:hypothetical protein
VPPFGQGLQGPATIDGRKVDAFHWLSFAFPFNFTGQPAATVPAGFTQDGLPIGLRIAGRRLDDALVLRASAAYEAAAPWRDRRPPMRTRASTSWMTFSAPTRSLRAGGRGADKPVGGDRDEMVDTIATCCQRINHSGH